MKKLVTILLLCFAVTGCGEHKPDGLPELVPCKIIVTQDGKPLADAAVTLVNDDTSLSRWLVGGRTNSSGVCNVRTHGKYNGAPIGSFKILVTKEESEIIKEKTADSEEERKLFDLVDTKYKTVLTTDLTFEVPKSGASQTFDVGKAVRKEIILVH
jgi:hypothetical protein